MHYWISPLKKSDRVLPVEEITKMTLHIILQCLYRMPAKKVSDKQKPLKNSNAYLLMSITWRYQPVLVKVVSFGDDEERQEPLELL